MHFALTSHGLGHLTRTLPVLEELQRLRPDLRLLASTSAEAPWLLANTADVSWRRQSYEPGAIQKNCFEVDVDATLLAYEDFRAGYDQRFAAEVDFLRQQRVDCVVSDIPALPVRAAHVLGLPAIGVSNFTWDWILEPWCTHRPRLVEALAADYRCGNLHIRLPFGPARSAFPKVVDGPLLARRASLQPELVKRRLGIGDAPMGLVCPGGWAAEGWPEIHAEVGRLQLVTVGNLPISSTGPVLALPHALPSGMGFPDLVNAADVLIGKPGYGLASECLAHRVPFVMIERPNFRETEYLVPQFSAMGKCANLSLSDFFAGDWMASITMALNDDTEWAPLTRAPEQAIAREVSAALGL